MASFDMHNEIFAVIARNTAAISTNTTTAGVIIDTKGYEGLEFLIQSGARTDGSYLPLIEESDDSGMAGAVAVADEDLLGLEVDATIAAANTVKRIGYVGHKRYVRLSLVSTGVTTGATLGAVAILSRGIMRPSPAN
jgi:hypothetical protein